MINTTITGFQKLTLLDYPGKMAAILFLPGCNMACPFCHNSELIHNPPMILDNTEIFTFLKKRKNILEGVVISGGEPTLQDIKPLAQNLKSLGYSVKLDTNGLRPYQIDELLTYRLVDYIAMDIKNSPAKYRKTSGCILSSSEITDAVNKSINLIMNSGIEYEFRTTVTPSFHETSDFKEIGQWIEGASHYYLQAFVMQQTVPDKNIIAPSDGFLTSCMNTIKPFVKDVQIRGRDI